MSQCVGMGLRAKIVCERRPVCRNIPFGVGGAKDGEQHGVTVSARGKTKGERKETREKNRGKTEDVQYPGVYEHMPNNHAKEQRRKRQDERGTK